MQYYCTFFVNYVSDYLSLTDQPKKKDEINGLLNYSFLSSSSLKSFSLSIFEIFLTNQPRQLSFEASSPELNPILSGNLIHIILSRGERGIFTSSSNYGLCSALKIGLLVLRCIYQKKKKCYVLHI